MWMRLADGVVFAIEADVINLIENPIKTKSMIGVPVTLWASGHENIHLCDFNKEVPTWSFGKGPLQNS